MGRAVRVDGPNCGGSALAGAVEDLYRQGQTDYALDPIVLVDPPGRPVGRIEDGDGVIFCCRRGEREIQLTEAFALPDFSAFARRPFNHLDFAILTLYHEKFKDLPVAFLPSRLSGTLGEAVSAAGRRQLHVAESEKYAHVTFFFNGGSHTPYPGEDDVCVPSIHGLPLETGPEQSLPGVTAAALQGIRDRYDLIVVNFANGDVIGHMADCGAKVRCAQVVDEWLGRLVAGALAAGYVAFVTADHGNLETMLHEDGTPHVSHTANPVPFVLIDRDCSGGVRAGQLGDVAATILGALGIDPPAEMDRPGLAPACARGNPRRVLLLILDGWGIGKADAGNPIHLAPTPNWDRLLACYPAARLEASGASVGLQPGKAGNSEAGHLNLGAGRVVLQDDVRLDRAMQDGSFGSNPVLLNLIQGVRQRNAGLHLIGLLSERSSHGTVDYPLAALRMAASAGLRRVYLHMIFDGRSTEPGSAPAMLRQLDRRVADIGVGQIVTGVGRAWALDRDQNYARTRAAYDALVYGRGHPVAVFPAR